MDISTIFDNIYIWVLLVNSECALLLALVKYILYSHFTQNDIFLYIFETKNPCFVTRNCSKFSYICVFILSKKQCIWFYKNLQEWLVVESCPSLRWMAFVMLYRLVYNICSHFIELILAWSAYFHDTEQWCKMEYTLILLFQKWHLELVELSSEHSKVWKIVYWWDHFVKSI